MGNGIFWRVLFLCGWWSCAAVAEPVSLNFDQIPVKDFAKVVYGDLLKTGYVVHESADTARISVFLPGMEPKKMEPLLTDALKVAGLNVERRGGVVVIEREKEPEQAILTYRPKFRAVSYLQALAAAAFPGTDFGGRRSVPNVQPVGPMGQPSQVMPIHGDTGSAALFDKGTQDILVARVKPERLKAVRQFLEALDVESPEVVVRAVAYEVQKTDRQGSAIDLVLSLFKGRLGIDLKGKLAGSDSSISFKVGGFDALVEALDSDTRFRSLSRPSVRVKSGSLARFAVGSDVPVLGGVVTQNGGQAAQSIEYRSSGVLLDVTPQVRDGKIELKLKQEFSAFVQTSTGVQNSPTLNKRSAETELTLDPGEVVFIGGLEFSETTGSRQSLPFGIPFGRADEQRQNELVLMIQAERI